jgi:mutator protein MutT
MVNCYTLFGRKKLVPESSLEFRPTVYGLFIKDGKILVMNTKSTNKFAFPGGGVDENETLEQGLKREIKEELGINAHIGKFVHFSNTYFYYDPTNEAWDVYMYFFLCSAETYTLLDNENILDDESESPQWIPIGDLTEENFQSPESGIIPILKTLK